MEDLCSVNKSHFILMTRCLVKPLKSQHENYEENLVQGDAFREILFSFLQILSAECEIKS